jgi:hypothetical protein
VSQQNGSTKQQCNSEPDEPNPKLGTRYPRSTIGQQNGCDTGTKSADDQQTAGLLMSAGRPQHRNPNDPRQSEDYEEIHDEFSAWRSMDVAKNAAHSFPLTWEKLTTAVGNPSSLSIAHVSLDYPIASVDSCSRNPFRH